MRTIQASKPFDLQGKAALVTGGNGGIGLGMAKGLAQAGAAIAVVGRDESVGGQGNFHRRRPAR
jgi:NAD(P)-dependent dehydrogenase (short-subunit alcohol dehydrogenase family)